MYSALVGNTGFVGSNLELTMKFDICVNSQNVMQLYGKAPEILVYAGVRGTKFIANENPENDLHNIEEAKKNIKYIQPKELVLISTVDVYDDLDKKDELSVIYPEKLHPYGKNRYLLEEWVKSNIDRYHILRLPALFGVNLKKNFIHDLIDPIPKYLSCKNYEVINKIKNISSYYRYKNNIFELVNVDHDLFDFYTNSAFNAVYFTDSRAEYQYFDLRLLYQVINYMINLNIKILNCVTEPISSNLLYREIYGKNFKNEIHETPIRYHLKTCQKINLFGGSNGWLMNKDKELMLIKNFIWEEMKKQKIRINEKGAES